MQLNHTNRNYNLDLMKILACIAVVGLHTLQKDLSLLNASMYYMCGFAVPVFFMASGYILLNREISTPRYYIRKILNIFRVVTFWSVLYFLVHFIWDLKEHNLNDYTIFFLPLLVLKSFIQKGPLWHFWYLGALIILYAILPFLKKLSNYYKQLWIILLITCCTIQLFSYIIGTPLQEYCLQTFRLWTWLQYFILGGLVKNNVFIKGISKQVHTMALISITLFVVFFQNLVGRYVLHNCYAEYFYDSFLTILWISLLFTYIMKLNLSPRAIKVVDCFSVITMGVYILHPFVMKIISHFIIANTFFLSLIYFCAVLLVSAFLSLIIKKIPMIKRCIEL